jgi:CubicO group peptidase (beta-lactamase class C family)
MKAILQFAILLIFTSGFAQNNSSLSTKTIKKITSFVESKKKYYNSPSITVAITDENSTVYLKHFGEANKGDKYLIGSNSKSFSALLILILQEKGKLNINDSVSKYLNWFEYKNKSISNKITIKDLLQHTSGIINEIGETFLENDKSFDYSKYYSQTLKELDLRNLPKQHFKYSNANYRLLGLIIENITGKKFEECIETYIAKPMKLYNTSANINVDLIDSYQYFLYYPILKFNRSFHHQEAASGLISSTGNDMSIYLRNLMNSYNNNPNTIINSNIVKQLFTSNKNNKSNYGLGWRIVNNIFYHSGTNKSFESSMYILPSINKSIVVLINSNQAPDSEVIDGIASILLNRKNNTVSSFAYYRSLPIIGFILLIIFIFQYREWRRLSSSFKFSKKFLPNFLLISGIALAIAFLILLPTLNGVSLKTALQFDPVSGYSTLLIFLLLFLIFTTIYFNKTNKTTQTE